MRQGIGLELFKEVNRQKYYRLRMNENRDLCLDMKGAQGGDPSLVILWPCKDTDNANQLWEVPVVTQ